MNKARLPKEIITIIKGKKQVEDEERTIKVFKECVIEHIIAWTAIKSISHHTLGNMTSVDGRVCSTSEFILTVLQLVCKQFRNDVLLAKFPRQHYYKEKRRLDAYWYDIDLYRAVKGRRRIKYG
uniref:Uncharacterized protein n=1 Tax=Clandestinovirus TaxID=2831644 RepID=A0A8F8KNK3_9VIRU|nr:hypothetical protein KOM_12_162 [Clandestinovirus]